MVRSMGGLLNGAAQGRADVIAENFQTWDRENKRALEIIGELECSPRGLFTGAIGYFGYNGTSQFNLAIRTVTVRKAIGTFHVGAGITADSDPVREWEETLHKAAGILQAACGGKLFPSL